jgi:hypothetical protein
VVPQYTGTRKTDVWVATGAALVACAEKKGIPPPDGSIMASAPQGDELVLEGLPAGPKLSITVRSGQAVGGCADLPRLNPGEQRTLTIKAQDRPIELAQTDVSLELVLMPDGLALQGWLEAETGDFVEAFAPEACEVCALLDGMEAHAPDADAFHQAREAQGWDNLVSDYLESLGKSLGDRLRTWSAKGAVSLLGGMGLSGRLTADGSCPSHPTLRLETVGGISAAKAGADYPYTTTMTADPGDTLHIGGTVYLLPSAFIGGAIDVAASAATVVDARDALRQVVGCQALSAVLAAGGGLPASCGAACLTKLCEASIDTLWQRATSSSADSFESANLSFTVSASAKVDEAAVLTSWEGSWAGEFAGGPWEAVPLKGAASGAASP